MSTTDAPSGSVVGDSRWTEQVARARRGDRRAFGALHDGHRALVRGVLLARAPVDEVDDLMQEVFLKAWRELGSLRDDGAFAPWLCAIARSMAATSHRRRRPIRRLLRALPARHASGMDHALEILEEIRALPEAYREPLVLRLVERMSGEQIAARVGLTPGSVRVNLHRGMALLRERLEERP